MIPIVFMPGFDGDASLRMDFVRALRRHHDVHTVSYPARCLGTLDGYREFAMASTPVDWRPVLIAESFSSLVAARWAAIDPRVRGVVLVGGFSSNPTGFATRLGAVLPTVVKLGPILWTAMTGTLGSELRKRWSRGFSGAMSRLPADVVAERLRLIAEEDNTAVLGSLCVPVLVVQFKGDQVIGRDARDRLETVCHNAQVLHLPGPHFALEVLPQECAEAIGGRIRQMVPTAA